MRASKYGWLVSGDEKVWMSTYLPAHSGVRDVGELGTASCNDGVDPSSSETTMRARAGRAGLTMLLVLFFLAS